MESQSFWSTQLRNMTCTSQKLMSNRNPIHNKTSRCQNENIPRNKYSPWWHIIQKQKKPYNSNNQHSYLSTSSDDPTSNLATKQKDQNRSLLHELKCEIESHCNIQLTYHFQNTPSADSTMMSPRRLVYKALVTFFLFCILQQVN